MSNVIRSITLDVDQLARSLLVREDVMNSETTFESITVVGQV